MAITQDATLLLSVLSNTHLPKPLKELAAQLNFRRSFEHSQEATRRRFGALITRFLKDINELEVLVCPVCLQLRKQSNMQGKPRNLTIDELRAFFAPNHVNNDENPKVCKQCAPNLRLNRRPVLAVIY